MASEVASEATFSDAYRFFSEGIESIVYVGKPPDAVYYEVFDDEIGLARMG